MSARLAQDDAERAKWLADWSAARKEIEQAGELAGATGGYLILGDGIWLVHTKDEADAIRAAGGDPEPILYQSKEPADG